MATTDQPKGAAQPEERGTEPGEDDGERAMGAPMEVGIEPDTDDPRAPVGDGENGASDGAPDNAPGGEGDAGPPSPSPLPGAAAAAPPAADEAAAPPPPAVGRRDRGPGAYHVRRGIGAPASAPAGAAADAGGAAPAPAPAPDPELAPPPSDFVALCVTTAWPVDEHATEAAPLGPFHRRPAGRRLLAVVGTLLAALAVLLGVFLAKGDDAPPVRLAAPVPSAMPSVAPSAPPSFDPRPTLAIVQERGALNCGVENATVAGAVDFGRYVVDLCRAVASVVLGEPDAVNLVAVGDDRFTRLQGREVDVLFAGDALTLERVIREPTTGASFWFGGAYYRSQVVYVGLPDFVLCASSGKRHRECRDLAVCADDTPEIRLLVVAAFPTSFVTFGRFPVTAAALQSGACNVLISDMYKLYGSDLQKGIFEGTYALSSHQLDHSLKSHVVRMGDVEWSGVVQGVLTTLFRSTQIGIGRTESSCPVSGGVREVVADRNVSFYAAPLCVGNDAQVFQRSLGTLLVGFNNSYLPTIDAPSLGSLECREGCPNALKTGTLKRIIDRGRLNCGVYMSPSASPSLTTDSLPILVSAKYCRALAVAIFQGDSTAVDITYVKDMLDPTAFPLDLDVVAGVSHEELPREASAPYYFAHPNFYFHDKFSYNGTLYGGLGEGLGMATDDTDNIFRTFVVAVVTATIYAQQQGITSANFSQMPLNHLFGEGLTYMLRDVVLYTGNYDDILNEAVALSDGAVGRGWNNVLPRHYGIVNQVPFYNCDHTGICPPCQFTELDGSDICLSYGQIEWQRGET